METPGPKVRTLDALTASPAASPKALGKKGSGSPSGRRGSVTGGGGRRGSVTSQAGGHRGSFSLSRVESGRSFESGRTFSSFKSHPADNEEDLFPPVKTLDMQPGGGPPKITLFPLELRTSDYLHRALDMTCRALRDVLTKLIANDLAPPFNPPGGGAPLPLSKVQSLDLLRHCRTQRASLEALSEQLVIDVPSLEGHLDVLLAGMLNVSTSEGDVSIERLKGVVEAAGVVLSGEAMDSAYGSNLMRLGKRAELHEKFHSRREEEVENMGGPLEDASSTFDRLGSAGSVMSMQSMQSMRVREEDLREPDEDEEVTAEGRLVRVRQLVQKLEVRMEKLESIVACGEAICEAAAAVALAQHEIRQAREQEDMCWKNQDMAGAHVARQRAQGELQAVQTLATKTLEGEWQKMIPNKLSDEAKRVDSLIKIVMKQAEAGREYEAMGVLEELGAKRDAAEATLKRREETGKAAEEEGKRDAHARSLLKRGDAAMEKTSKLRPVTVAGSKGLVGSLLRKGETELSAELARIRAGIEMLYIGDPDSGMKHAQAAQTRVPSSGTITRVPSDDEDGGKNSANARVRFVARIKECMAILVRRQDAWTLLDRMQAASLNNASLGTEIRREALERIVSHHGDGKDSQNIVRRMEQQGGMDDDSVLAIVTDPSIIKERVEGLKKEISEQRKEQTSRWQGVTRKELPGGWLTRSVGSWGTQAGELRDPCGVSFGSEGKILVADRSNHRLQILSNSGENLAEFNGSEDPKLNPDGAEGGGLKNPSGAAMMSDGRIIVSDRGGNRVLVLSRLLTVQQVWGGQGGGEGMFQGPLGVLVVKVPLAKEGKAMGEGEGGGESGDGATQNGGGALEGDEDAQLANTSTLSPQEEEVFIADYGNHRIQVFGTDGVFRRAYGGKGGLGGAYLLLYPSDVAVWGGGEYVCVADTGRHSVVLLKRDGTVVWRVGGEGEKVLSGPSGISYIQAREGRWDGGEMVVISDTGGCRLLFVSVATGAVRDVVGGKGGAEGKLVTPRSVRASEMGTVVVADCGNHRIVVYDLMV